MQLKTELDDVFGDKRIGESKTRLVIPSMDVNTGGAGVLLALAATLDGAPVLPFFGRTPAFAVPRTPAIPDR